MNHTGYFPKLRLGHDSQKGTCVLAAEAVRAGDLLGFCGGEETDRDTVHSIHLGGQRIDPAEPFRFISHACDPNAEFRDRSRWLYAVKDIPAGAEITIDYLYTEPVISAPFACKCGASNCRGVIRTPAERIDQPEPARRERRAAGGGKLR
jgi:hypothetical protein